MTPEQRIAEIRKRVDAANCGELKVGVSPDSSGPNPALEATYLDGQMVATFWSSPPRKEYAAMFVNAAKDFDYLLAHLAKSDRVVAKVNAMNSEYANMTAIAGLLHDECCLWLDGGKQDADMCSVCELMLLVADYEADVHTESSKVSIQSVGEPE